jgi:hypothetical protein
MAQSILVFDFGTNEEAAQQARHKVDAWVQGFRLGKKILLRFEREEAPEDAAAPAEEAEAEPEKHDADNKKHAGAKKKPGGGKEKQAAKKEKAAGGRVRVLVRLDFSDHEKLTLHRWLDRIPAEEPFKSAKGEVVRHSDPAFAKTAELFDSLESRAQTTR